MVYPCPGFGSFKANQRSLDCVNRGQIHFDVVNQQGAKVVAILACGRVVAGKSLYGNLR